MCWIFIVIENGIMRSFMITGVSKGTIRLVGQVAYMGAKRNAYQVLIGRPEGKSLLGRPRHSWEDNIEMNFLKIRWESVANLILLKCSSGRLL
jgi:hypothetical protein